MILRESTLKRAAAATGTMIVGSGLVFGLMLMMNEFAEEPDDSDLGNANSISVEPKPDPPDKPEPKPEPKQQTTEPPPQQAPPPDLGSAIGSIGFKMPGLSPGGSEKASENLLGDVQASVMTADAVDQKPKPLNRVQPDLPRRVVAKQQDGKVLVKALVDTEGAVQRAKIVRSEPEGVYDEFVLEAVKRWRFKPASYEGKAVKTWIEVPFEFSLQ